MIEIRFAGFGGQGIIRSGIIVGKAASIYDGGFATMSQSFGPEARGGACSSQLVVSDEKILYPYVVGTDYLMVMSQEACDKFEPEVKDDGLLIIDEDLVKPKTKKRVIAIPATRIAEKFGNRIFANVVMLGFVTAMTGVASLEAMEKTIPSLVPERFIDKNIKAFHKGYEYGQKMKEDG
ncbi:MAG TPA: 2-oxoacid:acceptor oxidoreductase family protein [Candidatus Krumholzibacteriaceae bacterium]|nr:2-oxoacid:acceptor oxidoreductase family protein [Candidatus Krumholzibacteriaceae bacterium]